MTSKHLARLLPVAALLLLGGAARAQFPSAPRPYYPFAPSASGGYHGVPGRPSGPRTGMGPGQPRSGNPWLNGSRPGGSPGSMMPRTYPRPPRGRDREGALSPETAGKLAEGAAHGLSHLGQ